MNEVTDSSTRDRKERRARQRLTRSGGWSFWIATALLALIDALGVYLVVNLAADRSWSMTALFGVALIVINLTYLNPRAQASKWLAPGMLLMLIFVVYPVLYTGYISLTNYQTGNLLSKEQAISRLEDVDMASEASAESLQMAVYSNSAGDLALLVGGGSTPPFIGPVRTSADDQTVTPLADLADQEIDFAAPPEQLGEYSLLPRLKAVGVADRLEGAEVNLPSGQAARVQTLGQATLVTAGKRFTYDPATDELTDHQTDRICHPKDGTFWCDGVPIDEVQQVAINSKAAHITCDATVCDNVPLYALDQTYAGWRQVIGFDNYVDVVTNSQIRRPFLRVFAWNIVFAFGTVLFNFALGLGLALVMKNEAMRGRSIYRSIYIIPYAIPAFLSIFVWKGLLNQDFGKVNGLLGTFGVPNINWLGSTGGAMAAIFLVNLWLGFPYMFLIASGALTSIPDDLIEAAKVDGAGPVRRFRSVTLPLLLVSTAPLLIGAFAFNFNNFVLIYLLNGGGPPLTGYDVPVGATDLLISFTFDIAAGAGRGSRYALATAIVMIIFFFLATTSALSFRLTKKLEEIYE